MKQTCARTGWMRARPPHADVTIHKYYSRSPSKHTTQDTLSLSKGLPIT